MLLYHYRALKKKKKKRGGGGGGHSVVISKVKLGFKQPGTSELSTVMAAVDDALPNDAAAASSASEKETDRIEGSSTNNTATEEDSPPLHAPKESETKQNKSEQSSSEQQIQKIKAFVIKNYLPLGLALQLIVALSLPVAGKEVSKPKVSGMRAVPAIMVICIFLVSGMGLKTDDVKAALRAPVALVYGLTAILVLTPCMSFVALEVPHLKNVYRTGLAIFCCVPTTLTSGVALATQAKGNGALALLLTVGSNLLGIFTVPFALKIVLESRTSGVSIDAVALLTKLVVTILVPLLVGKALREQFEQVQTFIKTRKTELGLLNHTCLLLVVWQTMSRSADNLLSESAGNILGIILCGVLLHITYLVVNYGAVFGALGGIVAEKEKRTLLLLTSQKTLPVSITVISFLDEAVGSKGLLAIPCVIGHMSQLFIDAVIASRWALRDPDNVASENTEGGEVAASANNV
ncbi:sodium/bile acid cotransporter [Pseudoscourfieldia marina]